MDAMRERGASDEEVREAILHGRTWEVRAPRFGREMLFTSGYSWEGHRYEHKLVRVVCAHDRERVVVVTVLVLYGRWEV